MRRHVRSWRKPTPHSRRIRWSAFGLLRQGPPAAQGGGNNIAELAALPSWRAWRVVAALVALGPRTGPLPLFIPPDGGGGPLSLGGKINVGGGPHPRPWF